MGPFGRDEAFWGDELRLHEPLVADDQPGIREEARAEGLRSLREFPDRKIVWPVDLTRDGFEMPKAWLHCDGEPRGRYHGWSPRGVS